MGELYFFTNLTSNLSQFEHSFLSVCLCLSVNETSVVGGGESVASCLSAVKRSNSPLAPACFTFTRDSIYREPAELVRMAGVPNVVGRRHARSQTAPQTSASASVSSSSPTSDLHESLTQSPPLPTTLKTDARASKYDVTSLVYLLTAVFCSKFVDKAASCISVLILECFHLLSMNFAKL